MPVTDEQFSALESRVSLLERARNETMMSWRWTVAKLGRIAATQDEHSLRLQRIEDTQDAHSRVLDEHTRILGEHSCTLAELNSQVGALPRLIAETINEVLDERDRRRRGDA